MVIKFKNLSTDLTLEELEGQAEARFKRECANEAQQVKKYLAEKDGLKLDEVQLPSDFGSSVFIIENGAGKFFGPYWAKRVDDDLIILRTGRRFDRCNYSEVIWDREYEKEEDRLDERFATREDWVLQEDDDYSDYNRQHMSQAHSHMKKANKTASSLFPDCKIIPYTVDLEKMLLWREAETISSSAMERLGNYQTVEGRVKTALRYANRVFILALSLFLFYLIWLRF